MAQEMAMLHDIARCSACRACMVACKQWHDLPADMSTPFEGQYQSHATLTPTTWNLIRMTERTDAKGKFHWDFVKVQCMHCGDPACTADALQFAPYEEIEEIARQRVKELQEDGYPDANVFNPQGVGGVHMIYVLPEKPEVYGFKPQAKTPVSIDIWKDVVRPLGKVAGVGALVGVLGLAAVKGMRGKKDDDENGKGEK